MDKIQAALCTAHKHTEEIREVIDLVKTSINRDTCNKSVLENLAILAVNLPLVSFAIENILDGSGVVVTSDINAEGVEFTRYLEDAKYVPKEEEQANNDGKHGVDPNIGKEK